MKRAPVQLDEEQALLDRSAEQFFATLSPADPAELAIRGYRSAAYEAMARRGWTGWRVPGEHEGCELPWRCGRLLHERIGRAAATEPLLSVAVGAAQVLRAAAPGVLRDALLAGIAAGTVRIAVAWPSHGQARLQGAAGAQRLSGRFRYLCPADADAFLVPAGERLLHVPRGRDGVRVVAVGRTDGGRWAELELEQVALEDTDVLAGPAGPLLEGALDATRLMAAAELLGLMQAGFDDTLGHLRLREQFGAPIGSFQALQHRAADLLVSVELSRAALERACEVFDRDDDATRRASEASGALARCASAAIEVLRTGVQLHGGIGYTDDARIGRLLRRAMVLSAWLGSASQLRARFGARRMHAPAQRRGVQADASELGFSPDEVRAFIDREYPASLRALGRRASWREAESWQRALHARGWSAPAWPREHGGMGLSAFAQVAWSDLFDAAGVNIVPNIGVQMLGPLLIRHGSDAQRARHLPAILAGGTYWCQGYSEPGAGSDLASLRTAARLEDGEFVVTGQKIWTSLAYEADWMFLLVRTEPAAPRHAGISFLLVDMKSPGITVVPIRNLSGASEFCQVFLDEVRVPASNLVGALHGGWTVATSLLGSERIALGSPRYVKRSLDMLRRLAEARGAFDDPVFADRFAAHRLDAEHIEALYVRTLEALRRGTDVAAETSLLKLVVSEAWQRIADDTRQLAGADGVIVGSIPVPEGDPVPALNDFLVSRSATIYGGTSEIQRNILARTWLELPGSGRAPAR